MKYTWGNEILLQRVLGPARLGCEKADIDDSAVISRQCDEMIYGNHF